MSEKAILLLAITVGFFLFMFAPMLIAYATRHPERKRIAALNPLALLSFLLWGALIAWAVGGKRDDSVIAQFVEKQRRHIPLVVTILVVVGVAGGAYAWTQRGAIAPTADSGSSLNTPSTPAAR
ncbi:superinfection immunity protein [Glacieibacterium frigidum]|uniref:Superinfection immunity protein n=1 Tax=Glacieibacterium frigidum TaxID=2593303 RepID=A0A552UAG1_9SPHN|nr:hypothetical protein [Glacieibacterium frigidum]TRW15210.1 hypothetical protein FMM06_16405 [Glacieibacterium frigidum]